MGSPRYPTPKQIRELRQAAELPAPEKHSLKNGKLTLTLPPQGLAVIELK
jgi:xylan 1,4-beta-xylosidase